MSKFQAESPRKLSRLEQGLKNKTIYFQFEPSGLRGVLETYYSASEPFKKIVDRVRRHFFNPIEQLTSLSSFYQTGPVLGMGFAALLMTGRLTYNLYLEELYIYAMGFAACCGGVTLRLVLGIDSYAVGKNIRGETNKLSRLVYKLFDKTLLRVYTLNRVETNLEFLIDQGDLRAQVRREKVKLSSKSQTLKNDATVALGSREERTYQYIRKASDPKKHFNRLAHLAFMVFGGIRMITFFSNGRALAPWQYATRIIGYTYGVTHAAGHIDAYVRRKVLEPNARPFFKVVQKYTDWLPIKYISRWFIHRDVQNYRDLQQHRQPLRRRIVRKAVNKIPLKGLRDKILNYLNKNDYILTEKVQARLDAAEISEKFNILEASLQLSHSLVEQSVHPSLREAWRNYKNSAPEMVEKTRVSYQDFKKRTEDNNALLRHLESCLERFGQAVFPTINPGHTAAMPKLAKAKPFVRLTA